MLYRLWDDATRRDKKSLDYTKQVDKNKLFFYTQERKIPTAKWQKLIQEILEKKPQLFLFDPKSNLTKQSPTSSRYSRKTCTNAVPEDRP